MSLLIQNGLIVTMNPQREILKGDVYVENGTIKKIAKKITPPKNKKCKIIDASDKFVIPGFVQAHVHLCQILFRGEADDLSLLSWLSQKIWPFEAAHTPKSLQAGARLGLLEMQKLGTTSVLDMGTVQHTDSLLEAVEESGMRYWGGKCLMDAKERSGPLYEDTKTSIKETEALIKEWGSKTPLLNYALCPRFAVSCTEEILETCSHLQKDHNILIHTHASESQEEIALIRKLTGLGNVEYFEKLGMLNKKTVLVHGVHISDLELEAMIEAECPLVHCPSSNLKLASGIAPIQKYYQKGLKIGLGCDGAPCNNTMDPFVEMRLCALLQKPQFGPEALPAEIALELATLGGARVLNQESKIGSLEEGKAADIVVVDRSHPSVCTVEDPYSALVYSCSGRDVTDVVIDGKVIVQNRKHKVWDEDEIIATARREKKALLKRAAHTTIV